MKNEILATKTSVIVFHSLFQLFLVENFFEKYVSTNLLILQAEILTVFVENVVILFITGEIVNRIEPLVQ